jgi:hypothetical protein
MEIVLVGLEAEKPPLHGLEHKTVRYIRRQDLSSYLMAQTKRPRQSRGEIIEFICKGNEEVRERW